MRTTAMQTRRVRSFARSAAVLAVIAAAAYIGGAIIDNTLATRDATAASTTSSGSARFAAPPSGDSDDGYDGLDWARSATKGTEAPRECEATRGLVAECVFMD